MAYVIYHITSTMEYKRYGTERGAKTALTKLLKKRPGYGMASFEDYRTNVVKKIKVTNMMSGKEVEIDSNTPNYCNPASEAYWSS